MESEVDLQQRARACALGAAIGDALGMPLEFCQPSSIDSLVVDMLPGRLPAGSFTDDTEMALSLAESYRNKNPLDMDDLTYRFSLWHQTNPPDIGIQTRKALTKYEETKDWQSVSHWLRENLPDAAGNGSVMRCWPAALINWNDEQKLISESSMQSLITHPNPDCISACVFVNGWIRQSILGMPLIQGFHYALERSELAEDFKQLLLNARHQPRNQIRNSGWVRHTLEAVVWGLLSTSSFEECLIQIINLGNDADTSASIAGAIAGAAFGIHKIPEHWMNKIRGEFPVNSNIFWSAVDFIRLSDELIQR